MSVRLTVGVVTREAASGLGEGRGRGLARDSDAVGVFRVITASINPWTSPVYYFHHPYVVHSSQDW